MFPALAYLVIALAGVTVVWGLITAVANKPPGKAQLLYAAVVELVTLVQSVVALVMIAAGFRPAEPATTAGYLVGIVILIPLAWFWAQQRAHPVLRGGARRGGVGRLGHDSSAVGAVDAGELDRAAPETSRTPPRTSSGAGRALVAVYGVFALAACARAGVQIATRFSVAPVAYLLSALAGAVYVVATFTLARGTAASRRVALVAILVELVGVLAVGTFSVLYPDAFPRATVWSLFGIGYGFVPLVLPLLGLAWLWHTRPRR